MIDWEEEVNAALQRHKVDKRLSYNEAIEFILLMYRQGYSLAWFQNHFFQRRVSWISVRRLLQAEGVPLRSRGGPNRRKLHCTPEELQALPDEVLAKKYDVTIYTVRCRRRKEQKDDNKVGTG